MISRDYDDEGYPTARAFDPSDTSILRRRVKEDGDDLLVVAQLRVANDAPFNTAKLCVLRHGGRGGGEWELKEAVPIVHHHGGGAHDLKTWQDTDVVVPVGDRFLCWVNFDCSTLLLWDTTQQQGRTKLRYVPLPVKPVPPPLEDDEDGSYYQQQKPGNYYRCIAEGGPYGVRFVSIDNRCCCGAHVIRCSCEHSSSAFMVTMWSLALMTGDDEPMAWVKECVLDCEELWSLVAGIGLPRVDLTCPVLSPENPDAVCFVACEGKSLWSVQIDVRKKTLLSAIPCPAHPHACVNYCNNLSAKLHCPIAG
ncbi:hypothetical protein HU200_035980 [Digitaria exilis]|uniref:DUF1618 domain-containing protein n=1 Tax=Digitaria exilis TaxID=1010633 RepID=A0A835BGZ7_9POAL|nr:hypothetical protein HU200_035980 [Digitaria exilis]